MTAAEFNAGRAERFCDWGQPHPAACEQRAAEIQREQTGMSPAVAAGCYVREACAELYDECPEARS